MTENLAGQPFLFDDSAWVHVWDGEPTAFNLFSRHYTARRDRNKRQFVGPGEKMVLLTPDARALFAWRKFISDAGELGVNCSVFRNEGSSSGRSSELIRLACLKAWERWPGERLYTYVDASKVRRKRDPGRCFVRAGWRSCGRTLKGKLIFEYLPEWA